MNGLNRLSQSTSDLSQVRSVASVFISRIDSLVDKSLDQLAAPRSDLKGQAAVANSRLIFDKANEFFSSDAFKQLAEKGAAWQRVLWGSTSTKNPEYSDVKYVEELIATPTVNTVPEATLNAFIDHGEVKAGLSLTQDEARALFSSLKECDIVMDEVCRTLLDDGVAAFEKAFEDLLKAIEEKAAKLCPAN